MMTPNHSLKVNPFRLYHRQITPSRFFEIFFYPFLAMAVTGVKQNNLLFAIVKSTGL